MALEGVIIGIFNQLITSVKSNDLSGAISSGSGLSSLEDSKANEADISMLSASSAVAM